LIHKMEDHIVSIKYKTFMEKNYLSIEKISSYMLALEFSNTIWNLVLRWDYFSKDTVGKQLVKAADSVSANIAEGFGRYSKKDKIRFYRISIGETGDWIRKSYSRNLITKEVHDSCTEVLLNIRKEILHLINFTNEKLKY
jgi:four helix bundle protein